jgi:H+/Cl- antiporter ClcA
MSRAVIVYRMSVRTRQLLVRVLGAAIGVGFIIGTFNDFRDGQYNWHGDIVRRANEPVWFWIGIGFHALAALGGFIVAVFGTGTQRKS